MLHVNAHFTAAVIKHFANGFYQWPCLQHASSFVWDSNVTSGPPSNQFTPGIRNSLCMSDQISLPHLICKYTTCFYIVVSGLSNWFICSVFTSRTTQRSALCALLSKYCPSYRSFCPSLLVTAPLELCDPQVNLIFAYYIC